MNNPLALTGWFILASLLAWFIVMVVRGVAGRIKADAQFTERLKQIKVMSNEFWIDDCCHSIWRLLWLLPLRLFETTAIGERLYKYRLKRMGLKFAKRNHWQGVSVKITDKQSTSEARGSHAE
jgi:hypothetical protein